MNVNYLKLYGLLSKRMLKKINFIVILCLIPVLTICLRTVTEAQKSGIVRIILCNEGDDSKAAEIISDLMDRDSVFLYSVCDKEEEAQDAIKNGIVDAAWIFPDDFSKRIDSYTNKLMADESLKRSKAVTVIEKEDSVLLQLARMELFGTLYSDLSYSLYKNYVNLVIPESVNDEEGLRASYDNNSIDGSLFEFSSVDREKDKNANIMSTADADNGDESNYLFAPIRGLLLLIVLLCGLSAAMYLRDDKDNEIFDWMPVGNRWIFERLYILAALVPGAVAVIVTFVICGVNGDMKWEIPMMLLYILMCDMFAGILMKLTRSLKSLATAIPILMIAMLVLCPVFIFIRNMRYLSLLFPPFYYLMSKNNSLYIMYGIIYLCITIVIDVLLHLGSRCSS